MSPTTISIDDTFGAALIGVLVSGVLLGVSLMQACHYFLQHKDKSYIPALVLAVVLCDVVHQALISHTIYTYLISFYNERAKLDTVVWSLLVEVVLNGLIALLVQCFFTYRIWMLSGNLVVSGKKPFWITLFVGCFVLAEFVCVLVFAIIALMHVKTFDDLSIELQGLSIAVNALAVAGDLLIAGILSLLLQRVKTGNKLTDTMINKLTLFAVNTGALTSLCAVASLISIIAAPQSFIYISFFFLMGRLYTSSLLAALNARKKIRGSAEGASNAENASLPSELKRSAPSSELVFEQTNNNGIEIQVTTTTEYIMEQRDVMRQTIEEEDISQITIISSQACVGHHGSV